MIKEILYRATVQENARGSQTFLAYMTILTDRWPLPADSPTMGLAVADRGEALLLCLGNPVACPPSNLMELTSLSLLDRLQQQPRHDDWSRLVALYKPFIESYIRLDSRLAADAEDICQEVLKKVVEHLPRFQRQRDGSFRAWLKTVTVNEVNQYWRQRLRAGTSNCDEGGLPLAALQDPRNELSQRWDREHADFVLRRLQELIEPDFSPTTWHAFRQRVFEELSTAEVAANLGISKNAVDIAKSRVLNRLRAEAAGFIEE